MKKSLAHLPKHKREELKLVTEIILDEYPTVLMLILFGSYARGDWVEDTYVEDGITYEYASDRISRGDVFPRRCRRKMARLLQGFIFDALSEPFY